MHTPTDAAQFEEIIGYLQQTRGFDFTAYKRTTLMRRVLRRMQTVGVTSYEQYFDLLQTRQEEFRELFNTILINVTSFYRDADVWSYLAEEILPAVVRNAPSDGIRVWSAGCASGEEAFTAAMALAELLGPDAFRSAVKIYATDIDEDAIGMARAGVFPQRQLTDLPPPLVKKYFDATTAGYSVKRDLRRAVIFGRHDLLQDAPISRVDLLFCRNTLMYFNADAQARILSRFFFALKPAAYVVLGRAEMLLSHGTLFAPVDLKRRVFRAVPRPNARERFLLLPESGRDAMAIPSNQSRLREMAFDVDVLPQLVVDADGTLVVASTPARQQFSIEAADIGRPFQDLEIAYRPAELRSAVGSAVKERRTVKISDVEWKRAGETRVFDVDVIPLVDEDGAVLGTRVAFQDVTSVKSLQAELQQSRQELETAYEELQSTNEELETTNEELQSTVEELETTNEELQSTNEELETMNEELQSTNEELQTMNDELRTRSTDLNSANTFLEAVFTSLRSAVVVLDPEFRIQVWNPRATDLWGLRSHEVYEKHFLSLDIGLPVAELSQPIRNVLSGSTGYDSVSLPATSRRGKAIKCDVDVTPLRHADGTVSGVILMMTEEPA
jgi:two-component system CheB/CheR fusion protein